MVFKARQPLANDIHTKERYSPLSGESQEAVSLRGVLNLGLIFFVIMNFRLLWDNAQKYGLLIKFEVLQLILLKTHCLYLVVPLLLWSVFILTAYGI